MASSDESIPVAAAAVSAHPMRRTTRVRWRMPLSITSLDPKIAFSELCETLAVNLQGAGVRSPAPLAIATPVRLETADHRTAAAWVTDFEPIGGDAKWWLLGVALEQPHNFWGVPNPPDNWFGQEPRVASPLPRSSERKFSLWPGAYGPQPPKVAPPSPLKLVPGKAAPAVPPPAPVVPPQEPPRPFIDPAQLLSRLQADIEQRTEEQWRRLRGELEPQLLASTRDLHQELQESLASWRAERSAVEGKLQQLLAVRDEVSAHLGSITSFLREQSAPLREEIIAEARTKVDSLIHSFEEHLRGERQKTDATLQQHRDHSAEEIVSLTSSTMDRLEHQLQDNLGQAGEKLRNNLLQEIQQRQQAASQAVAAHMVELHAADAGLRDRVRQLAEELSTQSERALAQLRVQAQELAKQQEQELSQRLRSHDAASEAALQTAGGRMLDDARELLQAEAERQQQQLAASGQSARSEVERLQRQAGELESQLTEVRQAREYVDSLSRMLPATIQQHVSEGVAAALEQMSGPAQEQFTRRVQTEITALQRRVEEIAAQAGASLSGQLTAEAARRDQQWQSSLTAGLADLQAQAAAIREEAAAIAKSFEQQQQDLIESAGTRLRELRALAAQREQQLAQLLAQGRQEANTLLQQQAAEAAAALHEQVRRQFEEGSKQFEQAQASAMRQLEILQGRADHVVAIVDVELQKHADDLVEDAVHQTAQRLQAAAEAHREKVQAEMAAAVEGKLQQDAEKLVARTVAAAGEQLQTAAASLHRDQLARTQAELDRLLGAVVLQATEAGSELRRGVESLQQELAQTKLDTAAIRSQVEQAQTLLAQQVAQFQATLHDGFLQATAEIRGRIRQAVEMAEEPLDRRSRDIQAQLTAAAQRMTDELQQQFAEARQRLQLAASASESHAEEALRERVSLAMETFRQDADNLARRSMERWQAAVSETLAEIPQLLGNKLLPNQQ